MAPVRLFDPFRELSGIQDRMNRLFEDVGGRGVGREEGLASGAWAPTVDIYETDDDVVVTAELPGLEKDQVRVEYKDGLLTLRGERKFQKELKEENIHRMERSYGSFLRSFSLPASIDPDKVNARFKNGVLEIRLAKKAEAKPVRSKVAA